MDEGQSTADDRKAAGDRGGATTLSSRARRLTTFALVFAGLTVVLSSALLVWRCAVYFGGALAAVSLARSGGLGDGPFAVAIWGGTIVASVGFAFSTWIWLRAWAARNKGRQSWWARHPLKLYCLGLWLVTGLFTLAAWDAGNLLAPVAGAGLIASTITITIFGFFFAFRCSWLLVRVARRWALHSSYRAGLLSGIALLLSLRSCVGAAREQPSIDDDRLWGRVEEVAEEARAEGSAKEFLRHVFAAVADAWLGPVADRPLTAGRLPRARSASGGGSDPSQHYRAPLGFEACVARLREERNLEKDRRVIGEKYGLGRFDADDVIAHALLKTCDRRDRIKRSLSGYFWVVADNEAKRQVRECVVPPAADDDTPEETCDLSDDSVTRDQKRLEAINQQLWRLDADRRRIIDLYVGHDRSFADIAAELGTDRRTARNAYYDAIKLIRSRLAKSGCDLD